MKEKKLQQKQKTTHNLSLISRLFFQHACRNALHHTDSHGRSEVKSASQDHPNILRLSERRHTETKVALSGRPADQL